MSDVRPVRWIDRSDWPEGPWDLEPDRVEWRDEATGMACLARRGNRLGAWCGYVAMPPGHPWHGAGYEDPDVDVHGGITFAGPCDEDESATDRICHVPLPGEPDNVWWLGFDCGHYTDLAPGLMAAFDKWPYCRLPETAIYRTLAFVQAECASLAHQAAAVAVA